MVNSPARPMIIDTDGGVDDALAIIMVRITLRNIRRQ